MARGSPFLQQLGNSQPLLRGKQSTCIRFDVSAPFCALQGGIHGNANFIRTESNSQSIDIAVSSDVNKATHVKAKAKA